MVRNDSSRKMQPIRTPRPLRMITLTPVSFSYDFYLILCVTALEGAVLDARVN